MITLSAYFMGRREAYPEEFKPLYEENAKILLPRVNEVLTQFYTVFPKAAERGVNSGWRPPHVNAMTRGASPTSLHMTGEAIDLSDDDEALDNYVTSPNGLALCEHVGLWIESPNYTKRWCHLQSRPPKSRNRIFIPR